MIFVGPNDVQNIISGYKGHLKWHLCVEVTSISTFEVQRTSKTIFMGSKDSQYGLQWQPKDICGSKLQLTRRATSYMCKGQLKQHGWGKMTLDILLNVSECISIFMNPHESARIRMNLYESARIYLNLHESAWICMNLHQNACKKLRPRQKTTKIF